MLAARTQQSIDEVAESLKTSAPTTQFLTIATDVSSESDVRNLFQKAIQAFGKVDVVVHCAGVLGPLELIGDAPVDEWWQSFVRILLMNNPSSFHRLNQFSRRSTSRVLSWLPESWYEYQPITKRHSSKPVQLRLTLRVHSSLHIHHRSLRPT